MAIGLRIGLVLSIIAPFVLSTINLMQSSLVKTGKAGEKTEIISTSMNVFCILLLCVAFILALTALIAYLNDIGVGVTTLIFALLVFGMSVGEYALNLESESKDETHLPTANECLVGTMAGSYAMALFSIALMSN